MLYYFAFFLLLNKNESDADNQIICNYASVVEMCYMQVFLTYAKCREYVDLYIPGSGKLLSFLPVPDNNRVVIIQTYRHQLLPISWLYL